MDIKCSGTAIQYHSPQKQHKDQIDMIIIKLKIFN